MIRTVNTDDIVKNIKEMCIEQIIIFPKIWIKP